MKNGQPLIAERGGVLSLEDLPLDRLAAAVGTPFYAYSGAMLERAYRRYSEALKHAGLADSTLCYAVKANPHLAVIRTFARLGAGADVVSEGELRRALAAGVAPERIVFAGIGKTEAEMALGLETGILQFNVESEEELLRLDRLARDLGRRAPVALRVNPDVDAKSHAKISTGKAETKFGIDLARVRLVAARAKELAGISLEGLAVHIGSQITALQPYEAAFQSLTRLFAELRQAGLPLSRLDLGGGLGVAYGREAPPAVEDYAAMVKRTAGSLGVPLIFEPGRYLVAEAGLLVARVLYVKEGARRRFLVIDAAMNDLIRPALYDAWHEIRPVLSPPPGAPLLPMDVVGPICETGDIFAAGRELPPLESGDLVAIFSTGAYGATMSSTYNSRLPAPEIMVRGSDYAVIKARPDHASLMREEQVPDWLLGDAPGVPAEEAQAGGSPVGGSPVGGSDGGIMASGGREGRRLAGRDQRHH